MPERTLLAQAHWRGPGHELVSDRGLSHHFQAMWLLEDSVNKMLRNLVVFPLSRSSEVTVLFTQLPVLAALLAEGRGCVEAVSQ